MDQSEFTPRMPRINARHVGFLCGLLSTIGILLVTILLAECVAAAQTSFRLGAISFDVKQDSDHQPDGMVVSVKGFKTEFAWPNTSFSDYGCVVRNPFATPKMEDGYVEGDKDFTVLMDVANFKASAFTQFAFSNNRPTTIGLLVGHAAANGESDQKLFFADVESGAHVLIPLFNGQMPLWLERTNYPPAFAIFRNEELNALIGARHSWRMDKVYRFSKGQYRRDRATEQRMLSERFQKAKLTGAQLQQLRQVDASEQGDLFYSEIEPFCDFVYYGTRGGHRKEVDQLIATLPSDLRKPIKAFEASCAQESRYNALSASAPDDSINGQATGPQSEMHIVKMGETEKATSRSTTYRVQPGDALYLIARRTHVTLGQLEAANPGVDSRRLRIGSMLTIPAREDELLSNPDAIKPLSGWSVIDVAGSFYAVNAQLGHKFELQTLGGRPKIISWQKDRGDLWSLFYYGGSAGTQYSCSSYRKILYDQKRQKVIGDLAFASRWSDRPPEIGGDGVEFAKWVWADHELRVEDINDGNTTIKLE